MRTIRELRASRMARPVMFPTLTGIALGHYLTTGPAHIAALWAGGHAHDRQGVRRRGGGVNAGRL